MFEWGGEVIAAAEAYHFVEAVRVFKGQVGGVVGAEAAAGGDQGWVRVLLLYERDDLVENIFFVLKIVEDAFRGMDMAGVEAFFVGAIQAVDLDGTGLDFFAKGVDDLPVFIIIKTGGAGGKKDDGVPGMAEDQQFHIPGEIWTIPLMIFSSHVVLAARYCWMISFHKA